MEVLPGTYTLSSIVDIKRLFDILLVATCKIVPHLSSYGWIVSCWSGVARCIGGGVWQSVQGAPPRIGSSATSVWGGGRQPGWQGRCNGFCVLTTGMQDQGCVPNQLQVGSELAPLCLAPSILFPHEIPCHVCPFYNMSFIVLVLIIPT